MKDLKKREEDTSTKKSVEKAEVANPKQFEEQRSEELRMQPQPLIEPDTK